MSKETEPFRTIVDKTPTQCSGCHISVLRASHLGQQVTAGELTLESAQQQFVDSFEDCRFGLVVHENRNHGTECGKDLACGSFVRTATLREHELALANYGLA